MTNFEQIDNWFTYHPPITERGQAERYQQLREAGKRFASLIAELVPYSPEQVRAVRKVREAVMWSNAGIACNEKLPPDAPIVRLCASIRSRLAAVTRFWRTLGQGIEPESAAYRIRRWSACSDRIEYEFREFIQRSLLATIKGTLCLRPRSRERANRLRGSRRRAYAS